MSEQDKVLRRPTRRARPATPAVAASDAVEPVPGVRAPRAAAPVPRAALSIDARPAEAPAIPRGLSLADPGLSGMPSLQPSRSASTAEVAAANAREQSIVRRETALPACVTLGGTLPLLAGGWFTLDRFSVVRDNALGLTLPVVLALSGLAFLGLSGLLIAQVRSLRATGAN